MGYSIQILVILLPSLALSLHFTIALTLSFFRSLPGVNFLYPYRFLFLFVYQCVFIHLFLFGFFFWLCVRHQTQSENFHIHFLLAFDYYGGEAPFPSHQCLTLIQFIHSFSLTPFAIASHGRKILCASNKKIHSPTEAVNCERNVKFKIGQAYSTASQFFSASSASPALYVTFSFIVLFSLTPIFGTYISNQFFTQK